MQRIIVDQKSINQRLDVFAHSQLSELSRSSVQKLIVDGTILVNDEKQKTGYKLRNGDSVAITTDITELAKIPKIELPILYEDENCIVINKPAGVLTHSKGAFNPEATVASFIAPKLKNLSGDRAGIVHRLDRATSGVMITAKNEPAAKWLQKQFSLRKVNKTYIAVVEGSLTPLEADIDMPIERNASNPKQFRVGIHGKSALTRYKTLQKSRMYSLIELIPKTGRTHQLRVHLAHINHPIVGDELYGGQKYPRLMLHAKSLEITLPDRTRKLFMAKVPKEFEFIMKQV